MRGSMAFSPNSASVYLIWAEGMPMDIRKSVWSFFGEGGRQYGKVAEL